MRVRVLTLSLSLLVLSPVQAKSPRNNVLSRLSVNDIIERGAPKQHVRNPEQTAHITLQLIKQSTKNHSELIKPLLLETCQLFVQQNQEQLAQARWLNDENRGNCFVTKLQPNLCNCPEIKCFTDAHGNVTPFFAWIDQLIEEGWLDPTNPFKIKKEDGYLVFLGDATDRGPHGAQVILLLMLFWLHNPDQVIFLKGNHESRSLNYHYGFEYELKEILGMDREEIGAVYKLYRYLPSACFLVWGNPGDQKSILLCHGGPHIGYSPAEFLASNATHEQLNPQLNNRTIEQNPQEWFLCQAIQQNLSSWLGQDAIEKELLVLHSFYEQLSEPFCLFQWTDIQAKKRAPFAFDPRRGAKLSKEVLEDYLQTVAPEGMEILGIIRGHQHGEFHDLLQKGHGIHLAWRKQQWDGDRNNPIYLDDLTGPQKLVDHLLFWKNNLNPFVVTIDGFHQYKDEKNTVLTIKLSEKPYEWALAPQNIA